MRYWRAFCYVPYFVPRLTRFSLLGLLTVALLTAGCLPEARAEKKTVCTITVNSADEKETFRRYLPADEFDFVELVERGRPDWLSSACRKGVRCDLLVISGHFDDGTEFYSGQPDARESLPVDELQRASCSNSCPGLFSQLKEVYLFGCNTLDTGARRSASGEIARSLLRAGYSPADVEKLSSALNERYGESNRDRMRQIFRDVPVIYGFSAKAPLGASAGPMLARYFQSGSGDEIGSGRASAKLVDTFAASSMTVTSGLNDGEPQAGFQRDVCRLVDERSSAAQKLDFVHSFMGREMTEVRMFLDYIERYAATLNDSDRQTPAVSRALAEIAADKSARARYLEFARGVDEPAVRERMLKVAHDLGWLSAEEQRAELMRMIGERIASRSVGPADVDLVCTLNRQGALGKELHRLQLSAEQAEQVPEAAVLACLGSAEGHRRMLRALTSPRDEEVGIAQVYFRHHPISDPDELRSVATSIARMNVSEAQVHALDTLATYALSDRESLEALSHLLLVATSVNVQRAIAGVLVRADYASIANPEFLSALRRHRIKSPDGDDLVDVLIRRLQSAIKSPKRGV